MKDTRILFVHKENKDLILINFFYSVSVFAMCSWEYHNVCVWCCWRRQKMHVHKIVFLNTSEDSNGEDDLEFPAQPYLFKPEYTDDE